MSDWGGRVPRSWAGRGRLQQRRRLRPADPHPALPAGGWRIRRWASPGSSTCWRRACTATAMTGARAAAPSAHCSRSCRCAAAAGAGPLGGAGSGVWAVPTSVEAGLEGASLELLGAGSPGRGRSQHRPQTQRELRKGSGILTPEALRLGASTLLESQNFGPFLQVGEHNLHFISKVRRWWGSLSPLPHFKSLPLFPILFPPFHHPPL